MVTLKAYIYFPLIHSNLQTSKLIENIFGEHLSYFISNYMTRYPTKLSQEVPQILNYIPSDAIVIGVHARIHRKNHYFGRSKKTIINAIFSEIDGLIGNPKVFLALATDNSDIFSRIKKRYGNKVLYTNAIRKPDTHHLSTIMDMILLQYSDIVVGTYRSSLSFMIHSRCKIKPYYLERESPKFLSLYHPDAGSFAVLYQNHNEFGWTMNNLTHICTESHVDILRKYYKIFQL
jgi:hypothetical protein